MTWFFCFYVFLYSAKHRSNWIHVIFNSLHSSFFIIKCYIQISIWNINVLRHLCIKWIFDYEILSYFSQSFWCTGHVKNTWLAFFDYDSFLAFSLFHYNLIWFAWLSDTWITILYNLWLKIFPNFLFGSDNKYFCHIA